MGWQLAPGETDVVTVSPGEGDLTLAAALFEDGTGQGEPDYLTRMRDYRAGIEQQFKRAIPILRQATDASADSASTVLEAILSRLSGLPEPPVGGDVSPDKAAGFYHAKQFIQRQVQTSADGLQESKSARLEEVRSSISTVQAQIEKALASLQRASATNK